MTKIKNIGRFCPTDDNGYIRNDSSLKKVKPDFLKVIDEVIEIYQAHLGSNLISIYIRGSIPRGLGINGVSDLDTMAITNKKTNDIDLKWVDKVEQELNQKFNCVNGVEFSFYHIEDILETTTFSIIPFMIKTHSVCVFGEDLTVHLPNYKADQTLGNEHLVNLKNQIEQAKKDLDGNHDSEDILDCCSWIMKIIVRAGLALVIVEENQYTRDLFPAYKLFAEYYPVKEPEMKQILQYAIDPVENSNEIINVLDKFGIWMINESEKWLQMNNPDKVNNMEL
ncbi:nucleotidyltransferase [Aquibacillus sp. 3ASR75-11]|uniref:Nucleotidyltransferase n=1 Tax=Terrihalobacillus insolitus TaxID=2950438 RepID=A0A9X3WSW1_9BACI|nr:nucleotidyltransferase [Terrihalobacillus insolitus]MDC3413118.1 nucleotidyltransferase [Terrihalobacillus insolitus]MDC3424860.1 nucleotidyltransferase [Terrihalobacillus insolitus]